MSIAGIDLPRDPPINPVSIEHSRFPGPLEQRWRLPERNRPTCILVEIRTPDLKVIRNGVHQVFNVHKARLSSV